jgi:hypothetical protein
MHMFTAAFRTLDLSLFVFRKGEDGFKWLFAIFAEEFVARHGDLQSKLREHILQRRRLGMAARKMTQIHFGPPRERSAKRQVLLASPSLFGSNALPNKTGNVRRQI